MKKLFVLISLFLTFSLSTFTPAFAEDTKTETAKAEGSEDKATETKDADNKKTEGKKGSEDEEPECD